MRPRNGGRLTKRQPPGASHRPDRPAARHQATDSPGNASSKKSPALATMSDRGGVLSSGAAPPPGRLEPLGWDKCPAPAPVLDKALAEPVFVNLSVLGHDHLKSCVALRGFVGDP